MFTKKQTIHSIIFGCAAILMGSFAPKPTQNTAKSLQTAPVKDTAIAPQIAIEIPIVTPQQAAKMIGKLVTVQGKVVSTFYDNKADSQHPSFLNLDIKFPHNPIAVLIFEQYIEQFPPINTFYGKTIQVTGIVEPYEYPHDNKTDSKPSIRLQSPNDLIIVK
jgi:hypothetical protein